MSPQLKFVILYSDEIFFVKFSWPLSYPLIKNYIYVYDEKFMLREKSTKSKMAILLDSLNTYKNIYK